MKLNKSLKNILIIVLVISVISLIIYGIAYIFAPGSYSRGKHYIISLTPNQFISKVKTIKEEYPQYRPFIINNDGEKIEEMDERGNNDYILHFYLKEEEATVNCIIMILNNDFEESPTYLVLNSIRWDYDNRAKRIGFNYMTAEEKEKSKIIIKKFETEILNRIGSWKRR